jgi:hypothetical protein
MKLTIRDDAFRWVGGILVLVAVAAVAAGLLILAHNALS